MTATAAMIGAGLIGRSWAMVFARANWRVRLYDSVPEQLIAAREHIEAGLLEQQTYGLADDAAAAAARVDYVANLEDAVADVQWVQENAPEALDVKRELYPRIDRATPPAAIIASSTSAIPASRFTEGLQGRERCLVAHPVNPPHLVPVVELCGAPWTTPATLERARTVMNDIGQVPILVKHELDGFILNRLQGALLSEALRLVGEGYVSPALYENLESSARAQARKRLDAIVAKARKAGARATGLLLEGVPHELIARAARSRKADLLVIGTHGRSGLAKLFLGSVATRLVSMAPRPVLTVRGK